ncbi:MAG: cytochrome ubiquinol oxidase subunit I [Acidimicrobiia bacterium]|nr:cytochrome ubiquinol oxidase subunit I [Acidimicrobiia bacterium]
MCFAIAFPMMTLFVEWRWLRTGDRIYRTLAMRWSRVMLVLFAVGAISGTILSFEFGILWPEFMARYGDVFGLAFAWEGYAFFIEAIFIAVYLYGWDRLPHRVHFLTGLPVVAGGVLSAYFVIAVNGWMNEPVGFSMVDGEVTDIDTWAILTDNSFMWHELVHMLLAGIMVAGFLVGTVYGWLWLKGRRTRYHRLALTVALSVRGDRLTTAARGGDRAGPLRRRRAAR